VFIKAFELQPSKTITTELEIPSLKGLHKQDLLLTGLADSGIMDQDSLINVHKAKITAILTNSFGFPITLEKGSEVGELTILKNLKEEVKDHIDITRLLSVHHRFRNQNAIGSMDNLCYTADNFFQALDLLNLSQPRLISECSQLSLRRWNMPIVLL
jgi:hypothetical protein